MWGGITNHVSGLITGPGARRHAHAPLVGRERSRVDTRAHSHHTWFTSIDPHSLCREWYPRVKRRKIKQHQHHPRASLALPPGGRQSWHEDARRAISAYCNTPHTRLRPRRIDPSSDPALATLAVLTMLLRSSLDGPSCPRVVITVSSPLKSANKENLLIEFWLINLGNTCYLNSVLQLLANL